MHPNEHRNVYWLSMKCVLASDQSYVSSWLVQPIKKLSSAAGLCAETSSILLFLGGPAPVTGQLSSILASCVSYK